MRRLWVVLVLLVGPLLLASPAQAGGWAVTVLDPLPSRVEADTAYTVGYWVLQHGSHPHEGTLGKSGLRLVGADGELEFVGRALPEPAHFAASIAVPAGTWRVYAMQGWFAEHEIGTLTVPGGLKLAPSEQDVAVTGQPPDGGKPYWGAIHPPYVTVAGSVPDGVQSVTAPLAAAEPAPPAEPGPRTGIAVILLAGCLAVALVAPRLRARLRG